MSAVRALRAAREAGVRVGVDGDALTLEADAAPPPAVLDLLACHKAGVVALLRRENDGWSGADWHALFDARRTYAEVDCGLPRAAAEARAFACCVAEWLNRNPVRSPPGRCIHCGGSEQTREAMLPFGAAQTGHAWLHLRCWGSWHTGRKAEAIAALSTHGIWTRK